MLLKLGAQTLRLSLMRCKSTQGGGNEDEESKCNRDGAGARGDNVDRRCCTAGQQQQSTAERGSESQRAGQDSAEQ